MSINVLAILMLVSQTDARLNNKHRCKQLSNKRHSGADKEYHSGYYEKDKRAMLFQLIAMIIECVYIVQQ
jgi:hypothetical protein